MAMFITDRPDVLDRVRVDFRAQNGLMYGVGNQDRIYTIETPPQPVGIVVAKVSQPTVALCGTNFGVDFNPAPTGCE